MKIWGRKLKVYLDTSVISHLMQEDVPEKWQIQYESYDITKDVLDVAHQLIAMGVLTNKSFDDCQHIGAAVVNNCDCIISWNFKHIVNIKTIRGVRAITNSGRIQADRDMESVCIIGK